MMPNEISRLAHALNELRPDWPVSSLNTWITRNLSNRTYRDAAVALVWVAVDTKLDGSPATERPARVLEPGPWWNAAAIGGNAMAGRPQPPKRHEQCTRCGGVKGNCACTREHLAATYADDDPAPAPVVDQAAALAAIRDAIHAAKNGTPDTETEEAT